MKYKELKPIKETTEDYEAVERKIIELFRREIYLPLIRQFSQKVKLSNSIEDLFNALQTGRITFNRGVFSGRFNSVLSRTLKELGATWNRRDSTWRIQKAALPRDVQYALSATESAFKEKLQRIDKELTEVVPSELAEKLSLEHNFDRALWRVDRDFKASVKGIAIAPELTDEDRARIAAEWQNNMRLWIKDFTEREIVELRKNMQKSILAGNRFESAIRTIKDSYGVTQRKAKFLARQETALLMTKQKEIRYQSAGVNEYKWRSVAGSPKHPVRPRHKALNDASLKGKIFRFDDPPVTTAPGEPERRNNPGADFNCRCSAIPVVRF